MTKSQIIEEQENAEKIGKYENTERRDIFTRLIATNDRVLAIFHKKDYDVVVKNVKSEYMSVDISIMSLRHALERLCEEDMEDIDPCSYIFVRIYDNGSASLLIKYEKIKEGEEYIIDKGKTSHFIESIYGVVYIYHSILILKGLDCEHINMGMYENKPLSFIADNIVVTIAPRIDDKKEEQELTVYIR
jgi:hypothetical protein